MLHGEVGKIDNDKSEDFLRGLNVYSEILNIRNKVEEALFAFSDLRPLVFREHPNRLQHFINTAVEYAELLIASRAPPEKETRIRKSVPKVMNKTLDVVRPAKLPKTSATIF